VIRAVRRFLVAIRVPYVEFLYRSPDQSLCPNESRPERIPVPATPTTLTPRIRWHILRQRVPCGVTFGPAPSTGYSGCLQMGSHVRFARFSLAFLIVASTLLAADPFVGTWKLNSSKSIYNTPPPKEETMIIAEAGGDLDITIKGSSAAGTGFSTHYTLPVTAGTGRVIESWYDGVSGRRTEPYQRDIDYSKGGKVVLTTRNRVSVDRKSMTVIANGSDAFGHVVEAVFVYFKQ